VISVKHLPFRKDVIGWVIEIGISDLHVMVLEFIKEVQLIKPEIRQIK
jgi:hypothetical protein